MKVDLTARDGQWETVHIGYESFEVLVTPPTYAQKLQDRAVLLSYGDEQDAYRNRLEYRVLNAITDWRGLEADGGPLEFSEDNLKAVCGRYPEAFDWISIYAHRAFEGTDTATLGNSKPASSESSGDATADQSPPADQ